MNNLFVYIDTLDKFLSQKISVNETNTKYITGLLDGEEIPCSPSEVDITWTQLVFIQSLQKIWTHGQFYNSEEETEEEKKAITDYYAKQYLTFIAREQGTFTLTIGSAVTTSILSSISYSIDGGSTWTTTNNANNTIVTITTPTVNEGDKVLWKGSGVGVSTTTNNSNRPSTSSIFSSTGTFDAEGNIMSLIYGDDFIGKDYVAEGSSYNFACLFYSYNMPQTAKVVSTQNLVLPATTLTSYCYYRMFQGCTSLTTAPKLPATTLADSCYYGMFLGCSLIIAPKLPATNLASDCYSAMFESCTSLMTAPELPATTLANNCYRYMFYYCTSLTTAPSVLPATTLTINCYQEMFSGCTSLTTAPKLPATTLADNCYKWMFSTCTSLTTAPSVLPATTLADSCYYAMFYGCTSLTTVLELPATTLADSCYCGMFQNCTSLTTAPELPATTLAEDCYHAMFYGCTRLMIAPVLSATTLANSCYESMFQGCTSLTIAPVLSATTLADRCCYAMFYGCTNLMTSPVLSATTLANSCYYAMFYGCTSLTIAPELPATTLVISCYDHMFTDCTRLTTAPELPATTLANNCYKWMFATCTSLTTAPSVIPATTLADSCCYAMFYDCTSLTVAPELPATTLAEDCYCGMFQGCTRLTTAPELSATTLTDACYHAMFYGCTSLTTSPMLPATTLASNCYESMFEGCTNISLIKCLATNISASGCTTDWVSGVAASGTFVKADNMSSWTTGVNGIPSGWTAVNYDDYEDNINYTNRYLTFKALENTTFTFTTNALQYSIDNGTTWNILAANTASPTINTGNTIIWKQTSLIPNSNNNNGIGTFSATGNFKAYGNIMSLLYGDDFNDQTNLTGKSYAFSQLFKNNNKLIDASNLILPATTLTSYCYYRMFNGCTSLTTTPELLATTLADSCYSSMFGGCTSLTKAPELPATTLAGNCYGSMFRGCTSLTTAPELPATTLVDSCYSNMFYDCTSLIIAPELPATVLVYQCYYSMFRNCTSLTTSPELPATTISSDCYRSMFYGCTNLITAPELPAKTLGSYCYAYMFYNCTSLTTAPELPATTLANSCYYAMFSGCTNLTTAPNLPATTLVDSCYFNMFNGCTSLTTVPELPATRLARICYKCMFSGCTSLTTAPSVLPATTLASGCYHSMFYNCISLTTAPELPATTLAGDCYREMFKGCTSLIIAPELPATTLTSSCYNGMFQGCTSLTIAPQLPNTTLVEGCYYYMFYGCISLKYIKCLSTDISTTDYTKDWVDGVAVKGTFIKADNMSDWTIGVNGIPSGWTVDDYEDNINYTNRYLTFKALENTTFTFTTNAIQYSIDNGTTWNTLAANTASPTINKGNSIIWKQTGLIPNSSNGIGTFSATGNFKAYGNIMSLLYGDDFNEQISLEGKNYTFIQLFKDNDKLIDAYNLILPATTLTSRCYESMFQNCISLTTAPELPAKRLANSCYSNMFNGCTSLTTAPALPAATLTIDCYENMFAGCTNLTTTPELHAIILADSCCYGMFHDCTSLTTAPKLSATTLIDGCYNNMFYNCTNLSSITCLATDISATDCITDWVYGVAATGIFLKADNMSSWTTGANGIPKGWEVYAEEKYNSLQPIILPSDNIINKILIPVDSSKNNYNGDSLSNSIVIPYTSVNENYLALKIGNLIKENYMIIESNIVGEGLYSNASILYNNGIAQIYPLLPLNLIKDNLRYLMLSYYINDEEEHEKIDLINLFLWFDDYADGDYSISALNDWATTESESEATDWQDYVENYLLTDYPNYKGANCYKYDNDTFEWEGEEYYIWKVIRISGGINYILTNTIDYEELNSHSLETDYTNHWCPYIVKFNNDGGLEYLGEESNDILIKVTNELHVIQDAWIKYFNEYNNSSYDDWDDYCENYLLNDSTSYGRANRYDYTGETITWEGKEYYLWVDYMTGDYYMITDTIIYQKLYNRSIESNHYNMNCPYVARLHDDMSLWYEADTIDDWLVKVIEDENNPGQASTLYMDKFMI